VQGLPIAVLVIGFISATVGGAGGVELIRWWRSRGADAADVEHKQAMTGDIVADIYQKVIDALNAELAREAKTRDAQSRVIETHERRIVALEVENRDEKNRHKLTESRASQERIAARKAVAAYEECERHREEDRERMARLEAQIAQIQEEQQ